MSIIQGQNLTLIDIRQFDTFTEIKDKLTINAVKQSVTGIINETISNYVGAFNYPAQIASFSSDLTNLIMGTYGIEEDSLKYFRFKINPNKLRVSRKKMISQRYTGGGWDVDTRGEEMINYSYSGSTGSLVPQDLIKKMGSLINSSGIFQYVRDNAGFAEPLLNVMNNLSKELFNNPKLSIAYIKFLLFEEFWKSNLDELMIIWEDNGYIGKLTNFNYDLDAQNPYQILYNFDLLVYPDFKYNLYTGWISEKQYKIIKSKFFNQVTEIDFNKEAINILKSKVIGNIIINNTITTESLSESVKNLNTNELKIENLKERTNNIIAVSNVSTSTIDFSEDEEIWFTYQGIYLYNKNALSFLKNNNQNLNDNYLNITPEKIAMWYREHAKSPIDVFEESVTLKYKDNIISKITTNKNTESTTPPINVGANVEKENSETSKEIKQP